MSAITITLTAEAYKLLRDELDDHLAVLKAQRDSAGPGDARRLLNRRIARLRRLMDGAL
jgi:hypothetical protein